MNYDCNQGYYYRGFSSGRMYFSSIKYPGVSDNGIHLVKTMDNFIVHGKSFDGVMLFAADTNRTNSLAHIPTRVFWANKTGLIRYESKDGKTWNLVDYSINQ